MSVFFFSTSRCSLFPTQVIKKKFNLDIASKTHHLLLAKLRHAVEQAKVTLSTQVEATVELDGLPDFAEIISREKFEDLSNDLFATISSKVRDIYYDLLCLL
jgi:molecular chaperone DnaK (HSP70)